MDFASSGVQREVWASAMPARVTAAPDSCTGFSDSPNQAQATTIASTGSSVAVIPARVAEMCRSRNG